MRVDGRRRRMDMSTTVAVDSSTTTKTANGADATDPMTQNLWSMFPQDRFRNRTSNTIVNDNTNHEHVLFGGALTTNSGVYSPSDPAMTVDGSQTVAIATEHSTPIEVCKLPFETHAHGMLGALDTFQQSLTLDVLGGQQATTLTRRESNDHKLTIDRLVSELKDMQEELALSQHRLANAQAFQKDIRRSIEEQELCNDQDALRLRTDYEGKLEVLQEAYDQKVFELGMKQAENKALLATQSTLETDIKALESERVRLKTENGFLKQQMMLKDVYAFSAFSSMFESVYDPMHWDADTVKMWMHEWRRSTQSHPGFCRIADVLLSPDAKSCPGHDVFCGLNESTFYRTFGLNPNTYQHLHNDIPEFLSVVSLFYTIRIDQVRNFTVNPTTPTPSSKWGDAFYYFGSFRPMGTFQRSKANVYTSTTTVTRPVQPTTGMTPSLTSGQTQAPVVYVSTTQPIPVTLCENPHVARKSPLATVVTYTTINTAAPTNTTMTSTATSFNLDSKTTDASPLFQQQPTNGPQVVSWKTRPATYSGRPVPFRHAGFPSTSGRSLAHPPSCVF